MTMNPTLLPLLLLPTLAVLEERVLCVYIYTYIESFNMSFCASLLQDHWYIFLRLIIHFCFSSPGVQSFPFKALCQHRQQLILYKHEYHIYSHEFINIIFEPLCRPTFVFHRRSSQSKTVWTMLNNGPSRAVVRRWVQHLLDACDCGTVYCRGCHQYLPSRERSKGSRNPVFYIRILSIEPNTGSRSCTTPSWLV